jgi:hypothetical protein
MKADIPGFLLVPLREEQVQFRRMPWREVITDASLQRLPASEVDMHREAIFEFPCLLRIPSEPSPPPIQDPPNPPENPDVPVREPDPEEPQQI